MKFENIKVYNFEGAFRGMRNPMNSWDKSDSWFGVTNIWQNAEPLDRIATAWCDRLCECDLDEELIQRRYETYVNWLIREGTLDSGVDDMYLAAYIGPNDMALAQRLIRAGNEHRKFMRQIFVTVDITAPLYWWKEMDTYKIGTTTNSTSTMHKLASTPITLDCFETDDFNPELIYYEQPGDYFTASGQNSIKQLSQFLIEQLEWLRQKYNETNDKRYWKELIRWLPESWLQTRTWTGSYENLINIYFQRRNHKLTEWHQFTGFIHNLPYADDLICLEPKVE